MGNAIEPEWEEASSSSGEQPSQEYSSYAHSRHRDVPSSTSSDKHSRSRNHVILVPLSGSPKSLLDSSLIFKPSQDNASSEEMKQAQRAGLIQHLPQSTWDEKQVSAKSVRECCICMIDFEQSEPIRYLPCMHYYHVECIDDWLLRSFTCPTCMEPVDAALLSTYDNDVTVTN